MIVLDTMDLEARDIVHCTVHEHHWRKEGKHHSGCGRGSEPFVAGYCPFMLVEREPDLPLDHRIHQQPHHREPRQGRNPCGFLPPHRTDGSRILDPAKAWFHREVLFLICLEQLRIRTPLGSHRGGQDGSAMRVLRGDQSLWGHDEAIADLHLGYFGLRWTASTRPFLRDTDRFDSIV